LILFVTVQAFVQPLLQQPAVFVLFDQAQTLTDHLGGGPEAAAFDHRIDEGVLMRREGHVSGLPVSHGSYLGTQRGVCQYSPQS
jgi:hypothetical protein